MMRQVILQAADKETIKQATLLTSSIALKQSHSNTLALIKSSPTPMTPLTTVRP